MMLEGRKRFCSSSWRRVFSSINCWRSSMADWRSRTAWAIMEAMMESRRTSSWQETSSRKRRSALSAPKTSLPSLIGTQMKEISSLESSLRAPVRLRNVGSFEMRGTTTGLPLLTTIPVTPSPGR